MSSVTDIVGSCTRPGLFPNWELDGTRAKEFPGDGSHHPLFSPDAYQCTGTQEGVLEWACPPVQAQTLMVAVGVPQPGFCVKSVYVHHPQGRDPGSVAHANANSRLAAT